MSKILTGAPYLPRSKRKPYRSQTYLTYVRGLWCVICGRWEGIQACHLRMNDAHYASYTGGAERPHDYHVLPMCHEHHHEQTRMGETFEFWELHEINDPFGIAQTLYLATWLNGEDRALARQLLQQWRNDQ